MGARIERWEIVQRRIAELEPNGVNGRGFPPGDDELHDSIPRPMQTGLKGEGTGALQDGAAATVVTVQRSGVNRHQRPVPPVGSSSDRGLPFKTSLTTPLWVS